MRQTHQTLRRHGFGSDDLNASCLIQGLSWHRNEPEMYNNTVIAASFINGIIPLLKGWVIIFLLLSARKSSYQKTQEAWTSPTSLLCSQEIAINASYSISTLDRCCFANLFALFFYLCSYLWYAQRNSTWIPVTPSSTLQLDLICLGLNQSMINARVRFVLINLITKKTHKGKAKILPGNPRVPTR